MIGDEVNANDFGAGLNMAPVEPPVRGGGGDAAQAPPPVTPAPTFAGLSPNYLDIVGQLESSGGAAVGNGGGKYQFLPSTAKQYGGSDDNAMNRFTADNVRVLSRAGIPINDVTAYVAHQQGAGGAGKLLTAAPDAIAADVVGRKNAEGNKPFFFAKDGTPLTVAQSLEVYNQRVQRAGSKAQHAVVASAAPGRPPEVTAPEPERPKTVKDRLADWVQQYVAPPQTGQSAAPAPKAAEPEQPAPQVTTVPLQEHVSGVVRQGGKVLFRRYGRFFDAHGNMVG